MGRISRIVFGEAIPDIHDFTQLAVEERRLIGFGQTPLLREAFVVLEQFGPKMIEAYSDKCRSIQDFLLQVLPRDVDRFQFCRSYPQREIASLSKLLLYSGIREMPVNVRCPVCPDYQGNYVLGDGVGKVGKKLLSDDGIQNFGSILSRHGFKTRFILDVADVEAYDERILQASGETQDTFLEKIAGTSGAIRQQLLSLGIDHTDVSLMSGLFDRPYADLLADRERAIRVSSDRKVRRVREQLMNERVSAGDFSSLPARDMQPMVDSELASHGLYGTAVVNCIILSTDALSTVPAYNFYNRNDAYAPVVYMKNEPRTVQVSSLFS